MLRTGILALLLCVSGSAFGTRLYLPKPAFEVIVCEPDDPKGEIVYIDAMALPLPDNDPLHRHFDTGICAGYDTETWETYVANHWRKNEIKVGARTDKGLVIEVKLPVVQIQTEDSVRWFRVDDIGPEIRKPWWKKQ